MPSRSNIEPTPSTPPPVDLPPAFALGHDGKIEGIYRPRDQRRTWEDDDNARLELAARPLEPAPVDAPPPPRTQPSRRSHMVAMALSAVALALPFATHFGLRAWNDSKMRSAKPTGLLVIDSVPSGATVFIEDVEVGRTPFVAPNTFQPGTVVPVRVSYPGAQPWSGTFPGGIDTSFTADLQPH